MMISTPRDDMANKFISCQRKPKTSVLLVCGPKIIPIKTEASVIKDEFKIISPYLDDTNIQQRGMMN